MPGRRLIKCVKEGVDSSKCPLYSPQNIFNGQTDLRLSVCWLSKAFAHPDHAAVSVNIDCWNICPRVLKRQMMSIETSPSPSLFGARSAARPIFIFANFIIQTNCFGKWYKLSLMSLFTQTSICSLKTSQWVLFASFPYIRPSSKYTDQCNSSSYCPWTNNPPQVLSISPPPSPRHTPSAWLVTRAN